LNSELCRRALEKIVNPNILVNLISRRVRQLNSGGGSANRPMVVSTENLGAADTALLELLEDKLEWKVLPDSPANETAGSKKRKRG